MLSGELSKKCKKMSLYELFLPYKPRRPTPNWLRCVNQLIVNKRTSTV